MPKLKPDTQRARRSHILDAAEACFARAGFHRTTMQHICTEAGVSPGALYVYFKSKEDLIAGIAERDRSEFQSRFEGAADAPDFLAALGAIGASYFVDDPVRKQRMCCEIGLESTRNETVGAIFRGVDQHIIGNFEQLFERLREEGRIAPEYDDRTLARLISVIGDGMMWRRAVDPAFDAAALMPVVVAIVGSLLNPTAVPSDARSPEDASSGARPTRKVAPSPIPAAPAAHATSKDTVR